MNRLTHSVLVLMSLALLAACGSKEDRTAPDVPFAPWGESYSAKPDFAQLEYDHPLSVADLYKITPKNLALLDQEQVDQIYARLSAGPIPDGPFEGDLFFPKGASGKSRLSEIAGGKLRGLLVDVGVKKLDLMGEILWKGKVFYRDQRLLRNRIEDLGPLKTLGLVEESDDNPLQKIEVNGHDQWLLFPARLYCGQSLLDSRRESIIIDYAFTDQLPGYRKMPDMMAGRDGFAIRDEIRMVRPGFYLGRAYLDRSFVVNFVLYNDAIAEAGKADFMKTGRVPEDCWGGSQLRKIITATSG
ncbi:hypothetical protein G3580_17290 [Nitrogeniibacter mangrovi]|uniref:Lipoprotein n=1 Tax=Nitrogeniibacter mangrovi TaxID=2016596 RepID=A0A6C1B6X0_9RHOO|nr:hypothetical protein [Nitrogeniibacter mangrovi]QID19217.1 hypothetical protein G3580_17290 [Nitrogeniibacter mangrovi]